MSRKWKTLGGIALIAFGVLLLFSMMGARAARSRAFYSHMAAVQVPAAQQVPSADDAPSNTPSDSYPTFNSWHGHPGRPGVGWDGPRGAYSPLSFLGGMFRLLLFGLIGILLLKKLRKHKNRDPEPVAKIVDEDDVENEIRVGDEVGNNPEAIDPDDMTVDDLVRAMKRLGIKKLEL
jgi:hypothetical protein